ncbi:holo-ACP synthase [Clostridium gasigenes]|uniref:holo-ACP synthase n=1 Tax=Clostridium gasigenes TaxID=94869 RepID=UPI001C0BE356|nr:holo-ACP synthase [Clostridium gasigenes]MBU3133839.1 holo-ACP synthase [Clostridium gasigenes]
MIIGIGTDIIEIERIEKGIKTNKHFLDKLFTKNEILLFESKAMRSEVIAGNFAAKEAVSKALGTGVRGFSFKDIEILRDELGKPVAKLNEKVEKVLGNKGYNLNISISHNNLSAIAFAVLEEK